MSDLLKRLRSAGLKSNDVIEIDQKEFEKELRWLKIILKEKEKQEKRATKLKTRYK